MGPGSAPPGLGGERAAAPAPGSLLVLSGPRGSLTRAESRGALLPTGWHQARSATHMSFTQPLFTARAPWRQTPAVTMKALGHARSSVVTAQGCGGSRTGRARSGHPGFTQAHCDEGVGAGSWPQAESGAQHLPCSRRHQSGVLGRRGARGKEGGGCWRQTPLNTRRDFLVEAVSTCPQGYPYKMGMCGWGRVVLSWPWN